MKRLLLPLLAALALPTAVSANPFSKDLVHKTNMGEKFIIKASTLTITPFTFKEREERLKNIIKRAEEKAIESQLKFKEAVEKKEKEKSEYALKNKYFDLDHSYDVIINMYSRNLDRSEERAKEYKAKYEKLKPIYDKFNDSYIAFVLIKYIPIFEDINNIKTIQQTKYAYCLNKSTPVSAIYHPSIPDFDELNLKVCKKYAKF